MSSSNVKNSLNAMDEECKRFSALTFFKFWYFREMFLSVPLWNIDSNENMHFLYLENKVPLIDEGSGKEKNNFFSLVVESPDLLPDIINGKPSVCKYTCTTSLSTREMYTDIFTREIMSAKDFMSLSFETNDAKEITDKDFATLNSEDHKKMKARNFYIRRLRFGWLWNKDVKADKKGNKRMLTESSSNDTLTKERKKSKKEMKALLNKWRENTYTYLFRNIYRTFKWARSVEKARTLSIDELEELDNKYTSLVKDKHVTKFLDVLKENYNGILYELYNKPLSLRLSKQEFEKEVGSYTPVLEKSSSVYTFDGVNTTFGEFAYANMRLSGDQAGIMSDFYKLCWEIRARDEEGYKLMRVGSFEEYVEAYIKEVESRTGELENEEIWKHKRMMQTYEDANRSIEKKKELMKKAEEDHKRVLESNKEIQKERREIRKDAVKAREILKNLRTIPEDVRNPINRWQMQKFLETPDKDISSLLDGWNKAEERRYTRLEAARDMYLGHTNKKSIEE